MCLSIIYIYIYIYDRLIQHRLCVTWTGGLVVEFRLLLTVVVGSISSGGDYGVHCWWDPIRSKQLFSVLYVARKCFLDFLDMIIPIYIFIIQRKKTRAIPCPHQPPTKGDNTVSVAQGGTGATKQLFQRDRVFKIIMYIFIHIRLIN